MRRPVGTALVGATILGLVGCAAPGGQPAVVDPPTVRIVSEGSSPLEADPAVEAARLGDLGMALARATGDLTIPEFTGTVAPGHRNDVLLGLRSQIRHDAVRVPMGPAVWLPMEIGEPDEAYLPKLGAGGVQIDGCFASGEWFATAEHEPVLQLEDGRSVQYLLESLEGEFLLADVVLGDQPCDATGAPVLEFEPALTVPSPITEESLVVPGDED